MAGAPASPPAGPYLALDEVYRAIEALPRGRPFTYGKSIQGRPLLGVELGPEGAARGSVLVAGVHALEWIGVACALGALRALAGSARRVVAFPLVNPDGYARVEADLRRGARRFRRGNARGVDLNRNFPTFFGRVSPAVRLLPWVFWPGPHPLSEPEIAGVAGHLATLQRQGLRLDRALSLHSFGNKVLFPHGGRWRPPHDAPEHRAAALALAARLGPEYQAIQSARWVPGAFAPGMELDYFHDHLGALSLLVECTGGGRQLRRPASFSEPFAWFNPPDPGPAVRRLAGPLAGFLDASP